VGKDVLLENDARVMELVDLGFGACRFVVAAPRGAVERSLDEYRHLGTLEVATKYPNVAERHFRARGIAVEIVKVAGSAEVAPLVGLADWIVDLVATGSTLRANGLAVVEEIARSTARLVANPASYQLRRHEIAPVVERLGAWAAMR
jgi:ATP phosphoribosyltransferase